MIILLDTEDEVQFNASLGQLSDEEFKRLRYLINKFEVLNTHDTELMRAYNEEFETIYDYSSEEDIKDEIEYLSKRNDLGAVERLRYLTAWYKHKIISRDYQGI